MSADAGVTTVITRRPEHCRTCRCDPVRDTDSLSIYPPNATLYGKCPKCREVRWVSYRWTQDNGIHHNGSPERKEHCLCCTHPHDLAPGGYFIPKAQALRSEQ
jgi:hypothetical protein